MAASWMASSAKTQCPDASTLHSTRADPGCAKLLPFVAELAVAVSALLPLSKEEIASP
jgi:hypothetical protein